MRPDESNDRRVGKPLITQRPLLYAREGQQQPPTQSRSQGHREPAANIIRGQIHSIYDGNTHTPTPQTTPVTNLPTPRPEQPAQVKDAATDTSSLANIPAASNDTLILTAPKEHQRAPVSYDAESPYDRTHTPTPRPQEDQWKKYHSAWQDYYKQYYERFYMNEIHKTKQSIQQATQNAQAARPTEAIGSASSTAPQPTDDQSVSKNEALNELREQVRSKVRDSAVKVRKSRHFVPIAAGVVVLLLFSFLQYNRTMFAAVNAYVTPGNIDPQNIIVDPTISVEVGPEPKLIIPKINVETPVIYGIGPDHDSQMKAMEGGVAHFAIPGANSVPGQVGNTVIAGHSSNDVFAAGDYKFIFAQNEKLIEGDVIYMNYEGVRYTYRITSREVVMPTDVDKIVLATDKPMLTLISCVPLGTADKRLLIFAEQIHPSPNGAAAAPQPNTDTAGDSAIPGNEPTFLERIFGDN